MLAAAHGILHWMGEAFDPQLAGYSATVTLRHESTPSCHGRTVEVRGIKMSLLDAGHEIAVRSRLPNGTTMFTGDDYHYVDLIAGDGQRHSDALLGAFAAVAPNASAAIQALDADDPERYHRILGPTEALARHIFAAPTFYYKTGVAFLAWLNGHQPAFAMVGVALPAQTAHRQPGRWPTGQVPWRSMTSQRRGNAYCPARDYEGRAGECRDRPRCPSGLLELSHPPGGDRGWRAFAQSATTSVERRPAVRLRARRRPSIGCGASRWWGTVRRTVKLVATWLRGPRSAAAASSPHGSNRPGRPLEDNRRAIEEAEPCAQTLVMVVGGLRRVARLRVPSHVMEALAELEQ